MSQLNHLVTTQFFFSLHDPTFSCQNFTFFFLRHVSTLSHLRHIDFCFLITATPFFCEETTFSPLSVTTGLSFSVKQQERFRSIPNVSVAELHFKTKKGHKILEGKMMNKEIDSYKCWSRWGCVICCRVGVSLRSAESSTPGSTHQQPSFFFMNRYNPTSSEFGHHDNSPFHSPNPFFFLFPSRPHFFVAFIKIGVFLSLFAFFVQS